MVVHFVLDAATADAAHSVKKKYLAARSREKKNSIFDYVHLSSKLLRKVRYGQSLDAAIQSPWSNTDESLGSSMLLSPSPSSPPRMSISTVWRSDEPRVEVTPSPSRATVKSTNQRLEKMSHLATDMAILFGRVIQLQAVDGGYLALDADGSLCKLPKSERDDPRTLLTLFPIDPLHVGGPKARVTPGTTCFIASGSATISSRHEVHYANAKNLLPAPPTLRDAVEQHGRIHASTDASERPWNPSTSDTRSWYLRPKLSEVSWLSSGMVVQLAQNDQTVHYEMERIVKRKHTPIVSDNAESDSRSEKEASPPPSSSPKSEETVAGPGAARVKSTRVWLQQNDASSQPTNAVSIRVSASSKRPKWDNLWFILDMAMQRRLELEQKKRAAILDAQNDGDGLDDEDDEDDGDGFRQIHPRSGPETPAADDADGTLVRANKRTSKRQSVINAHVFISSSAEEAQHRAARIILRFLQRVSRREAERRAKDLIDRRIRRTGKHLRGREGAHYELSTTQQLQVLQCFKPTVYGSQRIPEPLIPLSKSIPGMSMQGSKYPHQEAHRFEVMAKDLQFLNSRDFRQLSPHHNQFPPLGRLRSANHDVFLRLKESQRHSFRDRDRKQRLHVQLAHTRQEKPPFRFGSSHVPLLYPRHAALPSPAPVINTNDTARPS